jgi:16S rRNA (cytosine967-C5)-methyltransferase
MFIGNRDTPSPARQPGIINSTAAAVINKSDRQHPADATLRAELKRAHRVNRDQARLVSRAVFAFYRWQGWLDEHMPLEARIQAAVGLQESFQKKPAATADEELRLAVPEWIAEHLEVSPAWLRAIQAEPKLWVRARVGQGAELAQELGASQCVVTGLADAIIFKGSADLFRTDQFHAGKFEVQDLSSQVVGIVCDPQPRETWWDACAGEGGKTLHLCDLMRGRGLVWATDRAAWRLDKLKERAARASAFNYRAALWDGGAKLPTETKFDGILVDAPCSGTGTWQRNPHARWTTTANDVMELAAAQKQLLANTVPALKPGGRLIYSVCTLTHAETVEVRAEISKRFPELQPLPLKNPLDATQPEQESLTLWPQTAQANGMFICGWLKPSPTPAKP